MKQILIKFRVTTVETINTYTGTGEKEELEHAKYNLTMQLIIILIIYHLIN